MNDNELDALISAWKEDEMKTVQQSLDPEVLRRRAANEGILHIALSGGLALLGVASAWKWWVGDNRIHLIAALFLFTVFVPFVYSVRQMRRRAAEADALLTGSSTQLLVGQRLHLSAQLQSITGRLSFGSLIAVVVLLAGASAVGVVSSAEVILVCGGLGALAAHAFGVRAPRLRADIARVDSLISEFDTGG